MAATGTQSIQRAVQVLTCLANRNQAGARLIEITAATGLERPTARRILKALIESGLALQQDGHRYFLGPTVFDLGLTAAPQFDFRDLYEPAMQRLAAETGDTVFLTKRSGFDVVCVERMSGSFPVKAFVLDVGVRRPMGIGAGSLAMLARMPDWEAERVLATNAAAFPGHDETIESIRSDIAAAKERGFVVRNIPALGVRTIAVALHAPSRQPFAALSVATIAARMPPKRQPEVAAAIRREIEGIEWQLTERAR